MMNSDTRRRLWASIVAMACIALGGIAEEPVLRLSPGTDLRRPGFVMTLDKILPVSDVERSEKPLAFRFLGQKKKALLLDPAKASTWLPKTAITVEAWVKVKSLTKWSGIVGCLQDNGSYERGWMLGAHETTFYFGISSEGRKRFTYLEGTAPMVADSWYYVTGTYDGKTQRIYVDGKLVGERKHQLGPIAYAERLKPSIGSYVDDNDDIPLNGDLAGVAVWKRALSEKEIADRFSKRKGDFPGIEAETTDEASLDWPTYRRDNARSGQYPKDLQLPLAPAWVHHPKHPPKEAWPGTAQTDYWRKRTTPEKPRVTFDKAHQVAVADGRVVYGTSADDRVVCLDLKTGKELWDFYAEGPVRLAPAIDSGRVVFGSDDGYVYCLSLVDGKRLWRQRVADSADARLPGNGRMISQFPVRSGVLIREGTVYAAAGLFPSQGVWYASLSLADGKILDRKPLDVSPQGYLEARNGKSFTPTGRHQSGKFLSTLKRRGKVANAAVLKIPARFPHAFVATPTQRLGGGEKELATIDGKTGKDLWKTIIPGKVLGIAIANGMVLASTDDGAIHAFRSGKHAGPVSIQSALPAKKPRATALQVRVGEVLSNVGRTKGYALVVGDSVGDYTYELARQSRMQVIAVGVSSQEVKKQRQRLAAAGLCGQAVFHEVDTDNLPYRKQTFNLIVALKASSAHLARLKSLLRPIDGLLVHGGNQTRMPRDESHGSWSHLYANPENTACSGDLVSAKRYDLQWFGRPGPQYVIDRHLRAMSPVAKDGYLFVAGNNYLFGLDSFNGTVLWEKPVPNFRRIGVLRDSGSLAVGDRYLYVAAGDKCSVLNRITGEEHIAISLPRGTEKQEWGYLAVKESTVIGSAVKAGGVFRTMSSKAIYTAGYGDNTQIAVSHTLFGADASTGTHRWVYRPKGAVFNPSIALNDRYIFFLESRNAATLVGPSRAHYPTLLDVAGAYLVALDRKTGRVAWKTEFNAPKQIQTLFLSCTDAQIVVSYSLNHVADGAAKATVHYETRVFTADGKPSWQDRFDVGKRPNMDHGEQDHHPAIVGDRLIVEPKVYTLATGKVVDSFKRGYGCGTISASADTLFFRSGHPAAYSLADRKITKLNQVSRPGCWINVIPSDGLILVPEASSGCVCNFSLQCSMAFAPRRSLAP